MSANSSSDRMVIHIGAPKTGTTYFQKRLRSNLDQLRDAGVYVPQHPLIPKIAGNAKLLSTVLHGKASSRFIRSYPDIDVTRLSASVVLNELLRDWQPEKETVLLSSENFRAADASKMRELLPENLTPTIVLAIRRQESWISSYFNQLVKTGDWHADITTFIDYIGQNFDSRYYHPDWFMQYSAWMQAFGNCQVLYYEESRENLFAALCTAANLPPLKGISEIGREQVSLSSYQLAYLLETSPGFLTSDFASHKRVCIKAGSMYPEPPNVSLLSSENLTKLQAQYGESNKQLFAAIGRDSEYPVFKFRDPAPEHPSLIEIQRSSGYHAFRDTCKSLENTYGTKA